MLSCSFSSSLSSIFCCVSTCAKMPWWGGKSTSKDVRKSSKDNIFDGVQQPRVHPLSRRSKTVAVEDASCPGHRHSVDLASSDNGSVLGVVSRSPSPSTPSTRCPSFNDRKPHAQPLPLPCAPIERTQSGSVTSQPSGNVASLHSPTMPLPAPPELAHTRLDVLDGEPETSGCGSCSNSSVSSLGSVDVVDSWLPTVSRVSHLRPPNEMDNPDPVRLTGSSTLLSVTPKHSRKNSKQELSRPSSPLPKPSSSPKRGFSPPRRVLTPPLEPLGHSRRVILLNGVAANSTPGSSMSSPTRSPRRVSSSEQSPHGMFWAQRPDSGFPGSAQGSSPGSGHNSGHNSSGGDPAGQLLWNQSRRSPERSPIPSPRQRSPGPSSRAQSGTVSPLHPRASGVGSDWHEDGKPALHPLPLPPRPLSSSSPLASPGVSPLPSPTSGGRSSKGDGGLGSAPMKWQKGKLLGSGTFGNVYVGFNSDSGGFCAMKEVLIVSDDSKSKESAKQLGQEISLLSRLRHPNIVQYIGTETMDDKLCIYLEYMTGGSIHKLLQEYGQFKEPVIRSFTRQILSGLAYLHNMNTVHRDIKGANILVDTNSKVKLADFGMAKHITAQSFPLSFKGSPYWMAPEVIKQSNGYDLAVDIWSLGCTVLEMATAKPPWSQYEGVAAMFKIGNSKELPTIPDSLSKEGQDFVRACLQRNPHDRPTAQQLLEHSFVRNAPYEDRLEETEVLVSSATAGIRAMNMPQVSDYRHRHNDSESAFSGSGHMSRSRSSFSPTSSEPSPRNPPYPYGQSGTTQSPSVQSRGVHHAYNGLSSPPLSPIMSSGSSTPLNGAYGSSHIGNGMYGGLPAYQAETYTNAQRPNGVYGNGAVNGGPYAEARSDFHWATPPNLTPEGSPRRRDLSPSNDILGMALGRVQQDGEDGSHRQYHANGNLVEHVSQQLLRKTYHQPSPFLYRPTSPIVSRTSSELSH